MDPDITALETTLAEAIRKFHAEQQGCKPETLKVRLVGNLVLAHSTGIYTPTEKSIAGTPEGRKIIQSARRDQRSETRRLIHATVAQITGRAVVRSFWDIDVRTGVQIEVYELISPVS